MLLEQLSDMENSKIHPKRTKPITIELYNFSIYHTNLLFIKVIKPLVDTKVDICNNALTQLQEDVQGTVVEKGRGHWTTV